jgi:integrase
MAKFEKVVQAYVIARAGNWSNVTVKNARSVLLSTGKQLALSNDGQRLYDYFKNERELAPYTIKTNMIRVGDFTDWAMESGHIDKDFNRVKLFMNHHGRLFKRVYEQAPVKFTLEEVLSKIGRMRDPEAQAKAAQLVRTGMRYTESFTLKDGYVIGKGNAKRFIHTATPEDELVTYTKSSVTFWSELKKVGLKPHDLRKAHALFLASNGAHIGELMTFMGWRSTQSAASYTQHARTQELTGKLNAAVKKAGNKVGK